MASQIAPPNWVWKDDPDGPTGVYRYLPTIFSTDTARLYFITERHARDYHWLMACWKQGHYTHLGYYSTDTHREMYFVTPEPGIPLSGFNKFVYPLVQWIDWAIEEQAGIKDSLQSLLNQPNQLEK